MSDPGSIRNLEQLQEDDDERRMPRGVTMALVALGGACVVFAGLALGGRTAQPPAPKADPLGDLVSQHSRLVPVPTSSARPATDLTPRDVTFPQMLSDDQRPPTALAAVAPAPQTAPGPAPSPVTQPVPPPAQPPPPTDRLPVVPLPAQAVLEATPVVTHPRDALTKAASDAAQLDTPPSSVDGPAAPAGHEGGYQLQVSSFRTQGEAQGFADQLRARGHKAYVVEAHVPGRGTWFRVRIGPFQTKNAVSQYRTGFEAREHVVPFIVTPETGPSTKKD
ncbi:MAG TPA: SPOR domain-containing protein [Polyangiaceae bacterium]|nr:SPOR domain-containing protein [Polyangiaceae bacterium]